MQKVKIFVVVFLTIAAGLAWSAMLQIGALRVLTVSILDVGQGDSILIDAPNGNQVLVDAGTRDGMVVRSLGVALPWWDHSLDLALGTHLHADHVGGFVPLEARYTLGATGGAGVPPTEGAVPVTLQEGDRINLGSGVYLEVLRFSQTAAKDKNPNDDSLVSRVVYGRTSVLLTADIDQSVERQLVARYGKQLQSTVLKVAHHGSKTATTAAFLSVVKPEFAAISVGAGNSFGHPTKETLDRLEGSNIPVFRTDTSGTLVFQSDGYRIISPPLP